jgi:trehalose utilization protein
MPTYCHTDSTDVIENDYSKAAEFSQTVKIRHERKELKKEKLKKKIQNRKISGKGNKGKIK